MPMDRDFESELLRGSRTPARAGYWSPVVVKYLTPKEREKFQIHFRDGKAHDAEGNIFDTSDSANGRAIFVMDERGTFYASKEALMGAFHHSSFLSGKPVAAAGEIESIEGVIVAVSNRCRHYTPAAEFMAQAMSALENKGVDLRYVVPDFLRKYERPPRMYPENHIQSRHAKEYIDHLVRSLNTMLYPARGTHPLTKDVPRVMGWLVHGWLYVRPSKFYLDCINELLAFDGSLEDLNAEKDHSDEEIREFLQALASEIERAYPLAIRSGGIASTTGKWSCVEQPQWEEAFQKGDVLPHMNGKQAVWEYKSDLSYLAEDIIKREFNSYYLPKVIKNRLLYLDAQDFVDASIPRMLENVEPTELEKMAALLQAMSEDRPHPMTKAIEKETAVIWTEKENAWTWYQQLNSEMASRLRQQIAS